MAARFVARDSTALAALLLVGTASAQLPSFSTPVTPTGKPATRLAAADLDHDGNADAVVACNSTDEVAIAYGDGTGRFAAGPALSCGDGPNALVLADLDSDGEVDAAVANQGGDLGVLRGTPAGAFLPVASIPLGVALHVLAAADVDVDGDLDLVAGSAATATQSIRTVRNGGAGTFTVVPSSTFYAVRALAATDVSGDGFPDAVAISASAPVGLVVARGAGDGSFAYFVHASLPIQLLDPLLLAQADVDGDGDVDSSVNDGFGSLRSYRNLGDGTLAAPTFDETPQGTQDLLGTDLDDDGRDDLLAFAPSGTEVLAGGGAGSALFAPPWKVSAHGNSGAVIDLDGDGRRDVLAADQAGTLAASLCDAFGRFGGVDVAQLEQPCFECAVADLDHDGDLDVAAAAGIPAVAMHLARNDGFGNLVPAAPVPVQPGNAAVQSVQAADANGDGNVDVILLPGNSNDPLRVALLDGAGSIFGIAPSAVPGTGTAFINDGALGDLDLDGDLDLATVRLLLDPFAKAIQLSRGHGDGTFSDVGAPIPIAAMHPQSKGLFELADLDQDGRLDIVAGDTLDPEAYVGGRLAQYRGTSAFAFAAPTFTPGLPGAPPFAFTFVHADGDGILDIAALQSAGIGGGSVMQLGVFRGLGGGGFAPAVGGQISLHGTVAHSLSAGDLDGNGFAELVHGDAATQDVQILAGNGAASYAEVARFGVAAGPINVAVADADGDGLPDLIGGAPFTLLRTAPAPTCSASSSEYGQACGGTLEFAPHLDAGGCPAPGLPLKLALSGGPGLGTALLYFGAGPAAFPVGAHCDLLTFPLLAGPFALPLGGGAGVAGAGGACLMAELPASALAGAVLHLQAFVVDTAGSGGFAATNGVRLMIQ